MSPLDDVVREVESARAAAAVTARRPRREVASVLAAAARRWRRDPALQAELPAAARLSPALVAAGIDITAEALDVEAMCDLVERELGPERPARPWLVAHVVASNVPALGVPAIVLACLAGAAVVVKSGRADRASAPAYRRALAAEDPELAAGVVTTYWSGGDEAAERAVLAGADVVVATGRDDTVAALAGRFGRRVLAHGDRGSVVLVGRDGLAEADAVAGRVALDVALHDQRGCLSPAAVFVAGDARGFAARLVAALETVAVALPPGPLAPDERGAHRTAVAEAEWNGATVLAGAGGTVLVDATPRWRPPPGRRTVWVHPLASAPEALPAGWVECVAVAGVAVDLDALRRLGVSRVCAPGRMQRPPLSWPRGQHAPLRALLALPAAPRLEVDAT